MTDFIAGEKGVPIRMPSVANLMIDSNDRDPTIYQTCWDFQITKNYSIMNGFFTRVATTEVVLEWCIENIQTNTNIINVDISGATGLVLNQNINFGIGFYTIEEALDYFVSELNDLSGTSGSTFLVNVGAGGFVSIVSNNGGHITINNPLAFLPSRLFRSQAAPLDMPLEVEQCPDLRLIRYVDITSSQLTYCQDVKDNSTAPNNKDVLCRWYMAWDNEPIYDAYGFPILMGYKPFRTRRLYNPPKQIKWDANQPIGNLSFQVYDELGDSLTRYDQNLESNWLMTLQLSEV